MDRLVIRCQGVGQFVRQVYPKPPRIGEFPVIFTDAVPSGELWLVGENQVARLRMETEKE